MDSLEGTAWTGTGQLGQAPLRGTAKPESTAPVIRRARGNAFFGSRRSESQRRNRPNPNSTHAKSGNAAMVLLSAGLKGQRPGENIAAAAVCPLRKDFPTAWANSRIRSVAPIAVTKPRSWREMNLR
mgnify:CR=1 FL=1